jgi:NAD kinase
MQLPRCALAMTGFEFFVDKLSDKQKRIDAADVSWDDSTLLMWDELIPHCWCELSWFHTDATRGFQLPSSSRFDITKTRTEVLLLGEQCQKELQPWELPNPFKY